MNIYRKYKWKLIHVPGDLEVKHITVRPPVNCTQTDILILIKSKKKHYFDSKTEFCLKKKKNEF